MVHNLPIPKISRKSICDFSSDLAYRQTNINKWRWKQHPTKSGSDSNTIMSGQTVCWGLGEWDSFVALPLPEPRHGVLTDTARFFFSIKTKNIHRVTVISSYHIYASQATRYKPSHWVCKPACLVTVPSQDKLGGLQQEGHLVQK